MSPESLQGLQAERTILAWRRLSLAAAIASTVVMRLAVVSPSTRVLPHVSLSLVAANVLVAHHQRGTERRPSAHAWSGHVLPAAAPACVAIIILVALTGLAMVWL